MGTHGRSGLGRALLGSVTEEALRSVDVDVLAVPPIRPALPSSRRARPAVRSCFRSNRSRRLRRVEA